MNVSLQCLPGQQDFSHLNTNLSTGDHLMNVGNAEHCQSYDHVFVDKELSDQMAAK
jgi:hypothetical protein